MKKLQKIHILFLFQDVFSFHPQNNTELRDAVDAWTNDWLSAKNKFGDMNTWDVTSVTDMAGLFEFITDFNESIGAWNTSNVTDMSRMFLAVESFNQPIENWNTGSVTNMSWMFAGTSFNQPIGGWCTGKVTDMANMFGKLSQDEAGCTDTDDGATDRDRDDCSDYMEQWCGEYDDSDFNSNAMCCICGGGLHQADSGAFNQAIGDWNTGSVTTMEEMFSLAAGFNQPLGDWNTGSVINMGYMFLTAFDFNQPIGDWNTGRVTTLTYTFSRATLFNQAVNKWNTGSVTAIEGMFLHAHEFSQPIADWNTGSVVNMNNMFHWAVAFNGIVGDWNTASVTNMANMFERAQAFNQPIQNWNTGSVTYMGYMFNFVFAFNQPVENWNTGSVLTMVDMFHSASYFNCPVGDWNIGSVTSMYEMFASASVFDQPVGNWNTASVTSMEAMFHSASTFNQPVGDWNIARVKDMSGMFLSAAQFCQSLASWKESRPYSSAFNSLSAGARICQHCAMHFPNCSSCTQHECLQCTNSSYLFRGNCLYSCPGSFFGKVSGPIGRDCEECSHSCESCDDSSKCTLCNNSMYLYESRCFHFCPSRTVRQGSGKTGRHCLACEKNCLACSDPHTCILCDNDTYLHRADCLDACPQGSNAVGKEVFGRTCEACEHDCADCSDSDTCTRCIRGYLHKGDCVRKCPPLTFANVSDGACQSCGAYCMICANASTCLACHHPKYLFEDNCVNTCPIGTSAGEGRICRACEDNDCRICSNVSMCEECGNSRNLYQGHCLSSCPIGTVQTGSGIFGHSCSDCEAHCLNCSSSIVCANCTDSKYLHHADCLEECPSGTARFGEEIDGRVCQPCSADCSFCSSTSFCMGCANGKYLHDANCLDSCPLGSIPSGSGAVGLSCQAPNSCNIGFSLSIETSRCEPSWPFWIGMGSVMLLLLITMVLCLWQRRTLRKLLFAIESNNEKNIRAAINRGKMLRIPESNQIFKEARRRLKVLKGKYTDYEALLEILDRGEVSGDMKLVRGSWLADRNRISRLKRQQELPDEAFWCPAELRSQLSVVSIVAISYCWLHPVNPDPNSKHLREIQHAIQLRLKLKGPGQIQDLAIFLDYLSLPQPGEQGDMDDPERGSCLTPSEEEAFLRGLRSVNIPYASQLTEVWMMKWVPEDEPRKYMMRGWPFFEQAVSSLIKAATMLIEINTDILDATDWIEVHENSGKVGRKPPMIPSRFHKEVASKTFTNGITDQQFVEDRYEETFRDVVGTAKTLWFVGLGWTDEDAEVFADIFPFAEKLERLLLAENEFTAAGAAHILRAGGRCPSLKHLDMSNDRMLRSELAGLKRIWFSFGKPPNGLRIGTAARFTRRKHPCDADADMGPEQSLAVTEFTSCTSPTASSKVLPRVLGDPMITVESTFNTQGSSKSVTGYHSLRRITGEAAKLRFEDFEIDTASLRFVTSNAKEEVHL